MTVYRFRNNMAALYETSESLPSIRKKAMAYLRESHEGYVFISSKARDGGTTQYGMVRYIDGRPYGYDRFIFVWSGAADKVIKRDGTLGRRL